MFIRKDVLKLAIPIMIEQTFVMLLGTCNTMMAGHIGEEAVSAIGMVDSINNMFISFLRHYRKNRIEKNNINLKENVYKDNK